MNWRFTMIDLTQSPSVSTILTEKDGTFYEPIGWTECEIEIKRDEDLRGVFFDYSFSSLKYTQMAYSILEAAYDNFGIKANVQLLIEYYCPDCDNCDYAFFYRAQFNFMDYKKTVGDFCFIDVPLETSSAMLQFTNLYNQKVDLENLTAFDLKTPLNSYSGIGQVITLKNKTVIERTVADNTSVGIGDAQFGPQPISYPLYNDQQFIVNGLDGRISGFFMPPFANVRAIEVLQSFIQYPNIGINTNTNIQSVQIAYSSNIDWGSISGQYLVYRPRLLPINIANVVFVGPANININFKGVFSDVSGVGHGSFRICLVSYLVDVNGNRTMNSVIYESDPYAVTSPSQIIPFAWTYSNPSYNLQPGEGLWFGVIYSLFSPDCKPNFTFDGGNFINITAATSYVDTPCKVFFVQETMSRIAENITNGQLPVVSDYYGRVDSQPYAAQQDGEGGLRVLTKGLIMRGLQARQAVLNAQGGYLNNFNSSQSDILNNVNIFALSFQDVFQGLDAIDCIGLGLEDDPTRPGQQRIRVERFDYFFQDTVLMTLDNVYEIQKETKSGKFFSLMNFGYSKWETNSYDGLDEFLTKRQYRSTFTTVSNTLDKTCNFVTSGYAIEYCRRESGDSTQDSEFDNDHFLICVLPLSLNVPRLQFTDAHTLYITGTVIVLTIGGIFSVSGTGINDGNYTVVACTRNIVQTSPTTVYGGDSIITVKETFPSPGVGQYSGTIKSVSPRLFEAEQGNVTTTSGEVDQSTTFMVDPSTVYNYRLSPFRNMLRWMKYLLAMYQNPYSADSMFIFVDGDGNYFATGQQADPAGKMENSDVKESQNLSIQIMKDQAGNMPIFKLEEDSLQYPMSADQFVAIKANPYGLIEYFHDSSDVRQGWISKISYQPVSGMAKFTLIPKR